MRPDVERADARELDDTEAVEVHGAVGAGLDVEDWVWLRRLDLEPPRGVVGLDRQSGDPSAVFSQQRRRWVLCEHLVARPPPLLVRITRIA